ncbi:ATP-dependent DNA helicase srs2 [Vanrija pseudolonga]|uniref:DNA 3'-5' helicase n=1 Tax=Vanrija pseudolonga TaxID=143232 RepID=A0AAF0Y7A4_9TREE|nr:ATP-dependent DNA helicase srs2 [Vanrija pseudolonga]
MSGPSTPGTSRQPDADIAKYPYLASLNPAQLKAVTAPPDVPLQILAGPGSGKTRVLTSRVAHLVKCHGYQPHQITAVTFTNKAAAEMRKRLQALLGEKDAASLVLGTFHATCARYLRRHGKRIGLDNNFAIADADDCKKIMARLLKERVPELAKMHINLKEGVVLNEISKAKVKEETPGMMAVRARREAEKNAGSDSIGLKDLAKASTTLEVIAELYEEYETSLRAANALDFDDLLVFGLRLFREESWILEPCLHILVDEFQDTNTTQYELMKCFAYANGGVSVVGDPDQSIYGWRSAEIENLNRMRKDFDGVEAINLEENYRSTGAILDASHSIVSQDPNRIPKDLYTSHPKSTPVTLKQFATPVIEASYISTEIKRLVAYSGGMLKYDDFAILLRYNALSRVIESSLQKDAVPSRVIGGHKFFERMEIKDLLAYLQLADNPNFTPAFLRVVNVPRRAIGDKSVADLVDAAKRDKVSPMELAERIIDGDKLPAGIKPAVKKNLATFVGIVRKLRRAASQGTAVDDLIRLVLEKTRYEDYLRTSHQDFDQRWENVVELINYSVTVAQERERQQALNPDGTDNDFTPASAVVDALPVRKPKLAVHPMFRHNPAESLRSRSGSEDSKRGQKARVKVEDDVVEILSSDDEFEEVDIDAEAGAQLGAGSEGDSSNPLRFFLQSSMLSTDTGSDGDNVDTPKVTISTVHAAKGLEWPVVFIPAVEDGTFPSYRCVEEHEIAEERRLLYVAMTRAQLVLSMSHTMSRMTGGEEMDRNISDFVARSLRKNPTMFSSNLPEVNTQVRQQMAAMLGRDAPDETSTHELIMKHVRAAPPLSTWDTPELRGRGNRFARREGPSGAARASDYWKSEHDDYAMPGQTGYSSKNYGPSDSRPGFMYLSSARSLGPQAPGTQKPPPQKIQSSNRDLPGALPFTFMTETARPAASLTSFTSGSSSSLAAMKSLGLPSNPTPATSASRPQPTVSSFQSASSASLSALKTLGVPELPNVADSSKVPLARGVKRLGMGRPAPWGSKKPKP